MPFTRPTLTDLRRQVASDIAAGLPGVDALLRYSNLGVLGDIEAGLADSLYGYLDWIARQSVPFTATDEFLEGWAALKGVTRKWAVAAAGAVTFNGTGGTIPAGALITRSDGASYTVTEDAPLSAGLAVASVTAAAPGALGNAATGTVMTLASAISGINSLGTVSSAIAGGVDVEQDDELRTRMIAAYSLPAEGGSEGDYVRWALNVPGVTRAWVQVAPHGAGTVGVLFMMDDVESTFSGFPQGTNGVATSETRDAAATGDQLVVANALYTLQPVTALVYAVAPVPNMINLTIAGLSGSSGGTRAAIAAAFASTLLDNALPGAQTPLSAIESAIGAVSGAAGFVITAVTASAGTISPSPAGNITSNAGALPVPGSITYI